MLATVVSDETDEPLYVPINVSNVESSVTKVTLPLEGAVHFHQTVVPYDTIGSPLSAVAPTLELVTVPEEPLMRVAFAKLSFAGPEAAFCFKT